MRGASAPTAGHGRLLIGRPGEFRNGFVCPRESGRQKERGRSGGLVSTSNRRNVETSNGGLSFSRAVARRRGEFNESTRYSRAPRARLAFIHKRRTREGAAGLSLTAAAQAIQVLCVSHRCALTVFPLCALPALRIARHRNRARYLPVATAATATRKVLLLGGGVSSGNSPHGVGY